MSGAYIDRLQAVNKRLNTTNIRGKDYAEVNQRVLGFWELWPEGRIETEWPELTEARAVCVCRVFATRDAGARPIAVGTAYEVKSGSGVNSTSYIENAETSAVGRALGFLGIGATNAIASAEEVASAIDAQERQKAPARDSKPARGPKQAKADKVPAKPAKGPQKAPEGPAEAIDETEAARRRLIDACNLLAAATGRTSKQIMQHVAAMEGFEKTAKGYDEAAKALEAAAKAKGVTEVK